MSVNQSEVGEAGNADVMLAQALAQAVREVGRTLATDPRRVQGMVSDVLGVESRTRRAEIDAVVLAAEESVPEDLLANRIDLNTALDRLHDRGLADGVALFAVEVWRYALGMLEDGAQPPSLSNSLEVSTRPATTDPASDPAPQLITDVQPQTVVHFAPPVAPQFATELGNGISHPRQRVDAQRRSRNWMFVAAALVVVLIAGIVIATRGGDDKTVAEAPASSTTQAATTTTTTLAATTTTVTPPQSVFAAETTALGAVTRSWTIADGQLVSTLAFANTTAADTTGPYYEVIPKSLAASASQVAMTSEHPFVVVKDDPVIMWTLTIPAGQTVEVTYHIDVADASTAADLERWKTDQITEAAAFLAERTTPPALAFTTADGTTFDTSDALIGGTAGPGAVVSLGDISTTADPNGNWVIHVPALAEGANPLTITTTNVWGTTATATINVNFTPPPPDTTPEVTVPKNAPPKTTPPGTPSPPVEPTPPAPPPVEPPAPPAPPVDTTPVPPPPTFSISISGKSTIYLLL